MNDQKTAHVGVDESRPLRILALSDFYPPVIGGLERHVQTLSRELVRRGHHVGVATLRVTDAPEYEVDEGVEIHRMTGWSRALDRFYESPERKFHPTVPDPGLMTKLRDLVRRERPDIVHGRGWMIYSFLPLQRRSGARLVVTLHDYSLVCVKKTYLHEGDICSGPKYAKCVSCATEQYGAPVSLALTSGHRLSSPLHHRVDRYIAISNAVAAASEHRIGTRGRPMDVVPSFVPDSVIDDAANQPRPGFLPPDDGYLLYVGGLGRNKGFHVLLDAYAGLSDPPPLVVVATPPVPEDIVLPDGVTLVAGAAHADVMASWARCSIGLVPSVWAEPFGQVAVEALLCGKPVVASAVGGLADIVEHDRTGLLVPPGDAAALGDAVGTLLADPDRARQMGEVGRSSARRFLASSVADAVEAVYRSVLNRGST